MQIFGAIFVKSLRNHIKYNQNKIVIHSFQLVEFNLNELFFTFYVIIPRFYYLSYSLSAVQILLLSHLSEAFLSR